MDYGKAEEREGCLVGSYFEAKNVSVGYQKHPLIGNIDFGLEKGEILTLIGPNGAGKSTILKSIARQLELIGGDIYLDGRKLSEMPGTELSKKLAVVLTEKMKTEMMTCEDVVATGRYPYTGRFGILSEEDWQIVEESMELVHVTAIRDQDFMRISDGQRQRVMLARAICQEPEIIILDEPTSYLDVKYKLEFLSVLQEMRKKKGLTVIMSLHELDLAERVSDRILCVNGTCVDRFGRPEEIFTPGYISKLFSISAGSFDEENGNMELERPCSLPEVFVIGGGGGGRNVYRKLQREGTAFITGILSGTDLDFPSARALAAEVIVSGQNGTVDDDLMEDARRKIDGCRKVICCKTAFENFKEANEELAEYAKAQGILVEYQM